jgi:hypothetical protein
MSKTYLVVCAALVIWHGTTFNLSMVTGSVPKQAVSSGPLDHLLLRRDLAFAVEARNT